MFGAEDCKCIVLLAINCSNLSGFVVSSIIFCLILVKASFLVFGFLAFCLSIGIVKFELTKASGLANPIAKVE